VPQRSIVPIISAAGSAPEWETTRRPYPQFGTAAVNEENQRIGQSSFNSDILHVEQRSKHGLTLTANYSFSKLIETDTILNDEDTSLTRRVSPFDHTHHFTVGGTCALPFGKGKMFAFQWQPHDG